jgi:chromosome segregation ATPase
MKLAKYFFFLLSLVLLVACSQDFSDHLKTIDNLLYKYDNLEKNVLEVDVKDSKQQLIRYEDTIEEFKNRQNNEQKPSKEIRSFINEFRTIKKTFKKVPKNVSFLKSSISQNKTQLNNLKIDVNKNSFNKEDLKTIIDQESEAFRLLDSNYSNLELDIQNQLEKFDSLIILSSKIKF